MRNIRRFEDLIVNDPNLTSYDLRLCLGQNDAAVAVALDQNDFVSELRIYLEHDGTNESVNTWPNVCRSLATRTALTTVWLHCSNNRGKSQLALLEAIEKNPSIKKVTVDEVKLTNESLTKCMEMGTTASLRVEFRGCSSPTGVADDDFHLVHGILF